MLAVLASISLLVSCHNEHQEIEISTEFQVTSPIIADTTVLKEYVSQVYSASHIEIRSQERGFLQNIYVDEGQFVKKGQLMFRIMPQLYAAETQKAQAEMDFATIEYQNTKSLSDDNIVSPNELGMAKAKMEKAKAELSLAQAHLGFTEIRAPFDGIMDRIEKRLGSLIEEGELLTKLSDNSKMWVYFNVPEAEYLDYMTKTKAGSHPAVRLKMANNALFAHPGVVETIEADFNNETGNIAFRATFQNPSRLLRHGETGNVLMPVPVTQALMIPQKATFEILDKKYVFVIGKDSTVQSRLITVDHELPHIYIISEGLAPTDIILLDGLRKVKNNDKIKYRFVSPGKALSELHDLHAE